MKYVDLFAGMGGFHEAITRVFPDAECVATAEIKKTAIQTLDHNYGLDNINFKGDIYKIDEKELPDFDILFAGFPCQPFSESGKRQGFTDTRGTLFFEIERILKEKKPKHFILENVQGLVKHDRGNPLRVILEHLADLGYQVSWNVLNSAEFGLAQIRKRIYIVGSLNEQISLADFPISHRVFKDIKEEGIPVEETEFTKRLLSKVEPSELEGKRIRDQRCGKKSLHSWNLELKGPISEEDKQFLTDWIHNRHRVTYKVSKGTESIMFTRNELATFYTGEDLDKSLADLLEKEYIQIRPSGYYDLKCGQLSFPYTMFIDQNEPTNTLTATDLSHVGVVEETGVRKLTTRECLRLSGYDENYTFPDNLSQRQIYDLIGNTVCVSVVEAIIRRIFRQNV